MSWTRVEDVAATGLGVRSRCSDRVGGSSCDGRGMSRDDSFGAVRVFDTGGVLVAMDVLNCESKEATEGDGRASDD